MRSGRGDGTTQHKKTSVQRADEGNMVTGPEGKFPAWRAGRIAVTRKNIYSSNHPS